MLLLNVLSVFFMGSSALVLPPTGRLIGGEETTIEERPYSASLQYPFGSTYLHWCGASILSSRYLLSVARCDIIYAVPSYYARVGTTRYNTGGQLVRVVKVVKEPLHDQDKYTHTVAIVIVDTNIIFTHNVVPTVLPTSSAGDPTEGDIVTLSGWGYTSMQGDRSSILNKLDLPTWDNERCKPIYGDILTEVEICFGGTPEGGTSACIGDEGSPITFRGVQVAIISGPGGWCVPEPNFPGRHPRVASVLDWIKEQAEL